MKTLNNQSFLFKGKAVIGADAKELKTAGLIQTILEESAYTSSRDIIKAAKIVTNLKVVDEKINLEDEDFKFVKQWADIYPPIVNKGLIFLDFFQQLEE